VSIHDWHTYGDYFVEIWFTVSPDDEGYPSEIRWEQLLARPLVEEDDCFQIESIPFYLKNVSRGDIVKATISGNSHGGASTEEDRFEFDEIVCRGGHNTYRLLIRHKHKDDPQFTESELTGMGLAVETQFNDFIAVDVPDTVDQGAIEDFLVAEKESGRWGMQDGFLNWNTDLD
jgi:hypothetical protein